MRKHREITFWMSCRSTDFVFLCPLILNQAMIPYHFVRASSQTPHNSTFLNEK